MISEEKIEVERDVAFVVGYKLDKNSIACARTTEGFRSLGICGF